MLEDLDKISDGKVYGINDMVRAACNDCEGCHSCCERMGDSIVLDPYDVWQLQAGTGKTFEELLAEALEFSVEEGLILPHLKMSGAGECCHFLNEEGRCSIHAFRPGLCRLFPLGRIYEEDRLRYFLQPEACQKTAHTKVKVSKWLSIPEQKQNEKFLLRWHAFRKKAEEKLAEMDDENATKAINMYMLQQFYIEFYQEDADFYQQFEHRMQQAELLLR